MSSLINSITYTIKTLKKTPNPKKGGLVYRLISISYYTLLHC